MKARDSSPGVPEVAFDHRGTEFRVVIIFVAAGTGIAAGLASYWKSWLVVPVGIVIPFACWYLMLAAFWLVDRRRDRK